MNPQLNPFAVAQLAAANIGGAFQKVKEESAIDRILSEASQSGNPEDYNNAISKIISQVSPERRGDAIALLQSKGEAIRAKQTRQRQEAAAQQYGYPVDAPPAVQKAIVEQTAADKRAANIFGGAPEQRNNASQQASSYASATDDQLVQLSNVKGYSEGAKQEIKRRQEAAKEERADIRELKKETLPIRTEIVNKANAAKRGIQNKTNLLSIIDKGNLDDPTWAIIAENLPFNLGKRLLSDDSVTYKAALVDEFSDLRNIFQGQTRVKELDILQEKLADLYLTDQQKKAVLKSRINALQYDVLREEAAAEVEKDYPGLGILEFSKKVDQQTQEKAEKLFNNVLEEQKAILDQAERRKEIPLDPTNPEDADIMKQILKDAGNNKQKALKLAKEKGYTFK